MIGVDEGDELIAARLTNEYIIGVRIPHSAAHLPPVLLRMSHVWAAQVILQTAMPTLSPIPGPEQVEPAVRRLAPDVVRVVLNDAPDWSGDPAVYIRVILSDEAVRKDRLAEVTAHIREALYEELDLAHLDRIAYFKFRSASEQARLREKAWE